VILDERREAIVMERPLENQTSRQTIHIRILSEDGKEIAIDINPESTIGELLKIYRQKTGYCPKMVRLMDHESNRLNPVETLKKYNVEEGDILDALIVKYGD